MFLETSAQLEAAGGNLTQAAPLAVNDFKDFENAFLGGAVAFAACGAGVLVLDFVAAFLQLADRHENSVQNVERLETGDDNGNFVALGDGKIFFVAHYGADMAGC